VAEVGVLTHGLEARVHLLLTDNTQTPLHEVVMEDSLVELMKNIGHDAGEDVGEGKVLPKWFIDWAQTFHIKLPQLFIFSHPPQSLQHVNHTAAHAFLKVSTIV